MVKLILNFCSIVAIDPAELEEGVADRSNVVHLKHKVIWKTRCSVDWQNHLLIVIFQAQDVAGGMLEHAASQLVGQNWRESYRCLLHNWTKAVSSWQKIWIQIKFQYMAVDIIADSAPTEYCPTFHCPCVCSSEA